MTGRQRYLVTQVSRNPPNATRTTSYVATFITDIFILPKGRISESRCIHHPLTKSSFFFHGSTAHSECCHNISFTYVINNVVSKTHHKWTDFQYSKQRQKGL